MMRFYGEKIKIENFPTNGLGKIVFSAKITSEQAAEKAVDSVQLCRNKTREIALLLRKEILSVIKKPLPRDLKLQHVFDGEVEVPKLVADFFQYLVVGPRYKCASDTKQRRVEALSEDAMFAVRSGNVMPEKHIQLAIALKSITGSKKVITILNRLGYCISYNAVEELETELVIASSKTGKLLPEGLKSASYLRTGLAFDNYDRFVDTSSGKGTMHDTNGIVYQDRLAWLSDDEDGSSKNAMERRGRRQRAMEPILRIIEPYKKK